MGYYHNCLYNGLQCCFCLSVCLSPSLLLSRSAFRFRSLSGHLSVSVGHSLSLTLSVCLSACEYCMRALEGAEENARRLSGKPGLSLPYPELCRVQADRHQACPHCQVGSCCLLSLPRHGRYRSKHDCRKRVHVVIV